MFYLAIMGFLVLNGTSPSYFAPNGIDWWFVPVTALFLHGFHPETINSVVPGGWSVAVEMTFYFIFPFLMCVRKFSCFLLILIFCIFLQKFNASVSSHIFVYEASQQYIIESFAFFNFFSQVPVFIMGIMAYIFLTKEKTIGLKFLLLGGAAFFIFLVEFWYSYQSFVSHHVIAGGVFAIFSIFLAYHPFRFFVNRLTVSLGKLSFSMYLIHIAVLRLFGEAGLNTVFGNGNLESIMFFLFVLFVSAGISWFTYRYIEKTGIAVGRKLIDRLEGGRATRPLSSLSTETVK